MHCGGSQQRLVEVRENHVDFRKDRPLVDPLHNVLFRILGIFLLDATTHNLALSPLQKKTHLKRAPALNHAEFLWAADSCCHAIDSLHANGTSKHSAEQQLSL